MTALLKILLFCFVCANEVVQAASISRQQVETKFSSHDATLDLCLPYGDIWCVNKQHLYDFKTKNFGDIHDNFYDFLLS